MKIQNQLNRQRVRHIVSSYQLEGSDGNDFYTGLQSLLQSYPTALIELAFVETLVDAWLRVPLLRGLDLLAQVHQKLQIWEKYPIASTVTSQQFYQITGLDPTPIFGATISIGQSNAYR